MRLNLVASSCWAECWSSKDVATRIINQQTLKDCFGRLDTVTPKPPKKSLDRRARSMRSMIGRRRPIYPLSDAYGTWVHGKPGMMYFLTKWGVKEPHNPQNHRVDKHASDISIFLELIFPMNSLSLPVTRLRCLNQLLPSSKQMGHFLRGKMKSYVFHLE